MQLCRTFTAWSEKNVVVKVKNEDGAVEFFRSEVTVVLDEEANDEGGGRLGDLEELRGEDWNERVLPAERIQ